MARYLTWLAALAAACLAPSMLWAAAQDAEAKVADKAVDQGDPDTVDPNAIRGEKWLLDLRFDHPEPIVVTTPGGEKEVYWYVVYTVTNHSGAERNLVLTFTLYADTAAVRRAGIYPTVYDTIKKSRKIRFLENAVQMVGKILPGEDNARTGVAIFAPLDRATDRFTLFVEGLSGEYVQKATADSKPEPPLKDDAAPKPSTSPWTPRSASARPSPSSTDSPATSGG